MTSAGACPTGGRGNQLSHYVLYAHCGRCDVTHGPIGSWPQQCLTPGCGDNTEMIRVDGSEVKR